MQRASFLVIAMCAAAGCRSPARSDTHDRPPPVAKPHVRDPAMIRALAVLATRREPTAAELDATLGKLDRGELSVEAYVDALVASDAFSTEVAPLVVLRHALNQESTAPIQQVLRHTDGTPPIYYLREPCRAEDAALVHPWWALDEELRVCPDSYQPQSWSVTSDKGVEIACLAGLAHRQKACGCGPNLVRCFGSGEQAAAVGKSIRDELRRTVAYVATHDLPLKDIFLSNATYRDRNAEYLQVSQQIESGRIAQPESLLRELASWPVDGQWHAREELGPGENAGILTAPQILYFQPDRRQRMSVIYDVLWCIDPDSAGATPASLLAIKSSPDFQVKSAGWKELAARPLCTNCHARLDYGLQYFWGFQNMLYQAFYSPTLQYKGSGPLYGDNADDKRGEGPLTPHSFAELATAQPEFTRCMARDFGEYVLGHRVTSEQLDALQAVVGGSPKQLMRIALLQLAEAWTKPPPDELPTAATAPVAPPPRAATLALTTVQQHALSDRCLDCHDAEAGRPDFSKPELSRADAIAVVEAVGFGRMPKKHPLPEAQRAAFVAPFIDALWTGPDADTARAFFFGRMQALPAFRPEVVFELVHQVAKGDGAKGWRMFENVPRSTLQQVSPGLAAITGLHAIEACRAKHTTSADVERCVDDALQIHNLAPDPR